MYTCIDTYDIASKWGWEYFNKSNIFPSRFPGSLTNGQWEHGKSSSNLGITEPHKDIQKTREETFASVSSNGNHVNESSSHAV